jgi:hypothetical protein
LHSTTDQTKTEAGAREIPISATLRSMLLEWRLVCTRLDGELCRVFPEGRNQPTTLSLSLIFELKGNGGTVRTRD